MTLPLVFRRAIDVTWVTIGLIAHPAIGACKFFFFFFFFFSSFVSFSDVYMYVCVFNFLTKSYEK
jgi:hypothetical protein